MGFSIGDKVMHRKFGAGQITGEEHRELVNGFKHYYVIKVIRTGATAYIPIRKMEELGVRLIMSSGELVQILGTLQSVPSTLANDYKKRHEEVQEKLGTGLPVAVAETIRDLTWRRKRRHLTQKDETLLDRGRETLASEMALATDADVIEAHDLIDRTLSASLERGIGQFENAPRAELAAASD